MTDRCARVTSRASPWRRPTGGAGRAAGSWPRVERIVRNDYELGALGSSEEGLAFYRARGWWAWRGRTFAATSDGPVRTADEDGCVFVHPATAVFDLGGDLMCDDREGDAW